MDSLYLRLGGYDGIVGFVDNLLPRLKNDAVLGRFWQYRGDDGIARERQLLIDYLCDKTGGSMYYTGRDMSLAHAGMNISEQDWELFIAHADKTMKALEVPQAEYDEIVSFVVSLKEQIVE